MLKKDDEKLNNLPQSEDNEESVSDINVVKDNKIIDDNKIIQTNTVYAEEGPITSTKVDDIAKKKKKAQKAADATKITMLSSAVVLIGASVIINNGIFSPTPKFNDFSLIQEEDTVSFYFDLVNSSKEDITITFSNKEGDSHVVKVKESQYYEGSFTNLDYSTNYTFYATSDKQIAQKAIISQDIYIKHTKFYSASFLCHCTKDGNATLSLNVIDEWGYWSNYIATLTSIASSTDTKTYTLDEPISGDHELYVLDLPGGEYTLVIKCDSTYPYAEGGVETLFIGNVKI